MKGAALFRLFYLRHNHTLFFYLPIIVPVLGSLLNEDCLFFQYNCFQSCLVFWWNLTKRLLCYLQNRWRKHRTMKNSRHFASFSAAHIWSSLHIIDITPFTYLTRELAHNWHLIRTSLMFAPSHKWHFHCVHNWYFGFT